MTISCKENGDDVFADNYAAETAGTPAMAPVDHLYETHSFYRQTRQRGKILKTVTELYLREDLGFGCYYVENDDNALPEARKQHVDKILGKPQTIESTEHLLSLLQVPMGANPTTGTAAGNSTSTTTTTTLVVCDTNVLLHNLDVLEQSAAVMPNLVIPQTALMECRANQVVAYDRTVELLRSVGKSKSEIQKSNRNQSATDHSKQQQQQQRCCIFFPDPHHAVTASIGPMKEGSSVNDENDARIRNVALFFGENLRGTNVRVVFLTDDAESRRIASATAHGSFEARSAGEWVRELERQFPTVALRDLVAQFGSSAAAERDTDGRQQQGDDDGNKQKKERQQFAPHVDALALSNGITNGVYHRGVLRSRDSSSALVTIRRGEERVAVTINGSMDRNRAVDGDVVAIALHPLDQWIKSLSFPKQNNESSAVPAAGIANDTVDPTLNELSNVAESMMIDGANDLRPTGKVVGIMRRNFENHSGSIYETKIEVGEPWTRSERDKIACLHEREHADGSATCVFFPVDKKVPPILIRTIQRDRLLGQRIVVCMDSWPVDSSYPFGHYVRTIGLAGTKDVETEVLLQQFDIPHQPFPASVLACLPPENYRIDEENSSGREDIRHIPVLSIDPPNCKDIDDALHCIELRNGNYQVGVHIADVTHFVKAGTAIDLEAANRSTSTYLVNKRLDMLPGLLTTDLCSLKGNVDRYAFSVLWEVSPDAEIINVNFKKTIIHSIAALTYQQAQSFIEQPDAMDDIQAGAVKRLALLARKFRKRRIDAGALTLASPEVKFVLDSESLNPTDVQAYALLEANAVVEEFMLLANVTVAKKILRHYPTLTILRRHSAPNRAMFDSLISKAKCRSLTLDIEDSKRLADSLDAATVPSDPYINKLLRILSTRCMSPAQYFCSGEFRPQEWHHYGLAAPVYTHFTSPIRRYADIVVHRLLAASIGVAPLPTHLASKSYLLDLAANMNRRHRSAQLAGRASVQLHTLIFFSGDGAKEENAYVLDVDTTESSEPFLSVMVPRYGIEGRVKLSVGANDPRLKRYPEEHKVTLTIGDESVSVQVFDKIKVRIWVKEGLDHQRDLILDLVEPDFSAANKLPLAETGTDLLSGKRSKIEESTERSSKRSKRSQKLLTRF